MAGKFRINKNPEDSRIMHVAVSLSAYKKLTKIAEQDHRSAHNLARKILEDYAEAMTCSAK